MLLPLGCAAAPSSAPPPQPQPVAQDAKAEAPAAPTATERGAPGAPPPVAEGKASTDSNKPADSSAAGKAAGTQPGAAVVGDRIGGGSLTQEQIRDVVTARPEVWDNCYMIGAGKSRDFVATVTVRATVGPFGTVTVADVVRSTAKNKKVDTCVADAFKQLKFPAPKGAVTSVITFPIQFEGTELVQ
ncbi:putative abductin-like protein [Chondromyces apiculatus DSM 436]|uniref:Putative abductin-like protein n=1 Tax=Chondromyces apiculatus DSM 436 TaxID=1192034 RepID=A0A017SV85_9BACT|nr:putative abductin-like protein [Chondromyces apiculatus DSM 436]